MNPSPYYFHFLPSDGCLQYGDGREVRVGETLTVDTEPVLCHNGLHACRRVIDALRHAAGPVLTAVTLGGRVLHGDDKSVGMERTCLWMRNCERPLREFSCDVAEWSLTREREAGLEADPCSWAVIEVTRRYLAGGVSAAAWAAAGKNARIVARATASVAASAAAWAAGSDAASAAANAVLWATARDAASAVAWRTAGAAAWGAFDEMLIARLLDAGMPAEYLRAEQITQ